MAERGVKMIPVLLVQESRVIELSPTKIWKIIGTNFRGEKQEFGCVKYLHRGV